MHPQIRTSSRWFFLVQFVLLVVWGSPALAQGLFEQATAAPSEPTSTESSVSDLSFEWNGYLRGDVYVGQEPQGDGADVSGAYGELSLSVKARKGKWGDAVGEFRLWQGSQFGEMETRYQLREAYVKAYLGPFDLNVGQQVIVWGRADGVNPTNNLTPVSMAVRSPNEDDRRLSNFAIQLHGYFQPVHIEAVWIPVYAPSYFPPFQLSPAIQFGDPQYPDVALENGTEALRLNFETAAIDGSVSYLYGLAPLPGITLNSLDITSGSPVVSVAFHPYRQHVVGGDFATTISDLFGLRGEVAYKRPAEDGSPDFEPLPELHYVVGLDKTFGDWTFIVQYNGKYVFDWTALPDYGVDLAAPVIDVAAIMAVEGGPQTVSGNEIRRKNRMIRGQLDRWTHGATARIGWALLYDTLNLELLGSYNASTQEWFGRFKASYDLADALTVAGGVEWYGGPDGTLYGTIDELMSGGFLELKASF